MTITLKQKLIEEAVEHLEQLIDQEADTEAEYHTYLAVVRDRLDHHVNRMQEVGLKWSEIDEV